MKKILVLLFAAGIAALGLWHASRAWTLWTDEVAGPTLWRHAAAALLYPLLALFFARRELAARR